MKKRKTILSLVMMFFIISLSVISSASASNEYTPEIQKRLEAGDVCGLIEDHVCEFCDDDGRAAAEICGDCGIGTLYSVCSGVRKLNDGGNYFYVDCYVSSHPAGCQTVQTRYYTDRICSNRPNCNFRECGLDNHIQSYFHTLVPSCKDDCYCSLPYVPRGNRGETAETELCCGESEHERDPIAAGDIDYAYTEIDSELRKREGDK
ncbi:MAG: hypothetical protein J6P89_09985 [Oscillospiraceae bacterium]|nr:hypothetical protein [Oscillospiraceae bacterium]